MSNQSPDCVNLLPYNELVLDIFHITLKTAHCSVHWLEKPIAFHCVEENDVFLGSMQASFHENVLLTIIFFKQLACFELGLIENVRNDCLVTDVTIDVFIYYGQFPNNFSSNSVCCNVWSPKQENVCIQVKET